MVAAAMSGLPRTKELVLRAKWGGDDKALTALCYEICKGLPQEWGLSQQEKETLVGISVSDSFSELCTSCLGRGTRLKGEVVEDCPQCEGTGRGGGQMHQRLDNPYKGYALSIMRDIDEWDNDGLRHVTKRLFAYKQS